MQNNDELTRSRGGHRGAATKMIKKINVLIDNPDCDVDLLSKTIKRLEVKSSEIENLDRIIQRSLIRVDLLEDQAECLRRKQNINRCVLKAERHLKQKNLPQEWKVRRGHRIAATKMINKIYDLIVDPDCDTDILSEKVESLKNKSSEIENLDCIIQQYLYGSELKKDEAKCERRKNDIRVCIQRAESHLKPMSAECYGAEGFNANSQNIDVRREDMNADQLQRNMVPVLPTTVDSLQRYLNRLNINSAGKLSNKDNNESENFDYEDGNSITMTKLINCRQ